MGEIVNLNRFRKERERAAKAAKAAEKRSAHGRTKADKSAAKAREDKRREQLEGHRLEKDDE